MSFATKGMTRGVQPVKTQAVLSHGFGHEFSNAGIIDYRPGVTFAGLFEAPTAVVDSKYCVNMDKSGNTVNMHISQVHAAPVAHFAASVSAGAPPPMPHLTAAPFREALCDVAARVAGELCAEAARESAVGEAPLAADMQMHIQSLNEQLNRIKGSMAGTSGPQHAADTEHLSVGLRHHTMVLRKTQKQLNSLQAEIQKITAQTLAHSSEIADISAQTASQGQEILQYGTDVEAHAGQLSAMHVGLLNHKDELLQMAGRAAAPSPAALLKIEAALANHRDEIRVLKTQPSVEEQLGHVQAQIDLLHAGLMNHKAVLSSKTESVRPSTSMQRSDLDSFMRLKQKR
jgi:hypothetical protein